MNLCEDDCVLRSEVGHKYHVQAVVSNPAIAKIHSELWDSAL